MDLKSQMAQMSAYMAEQMKYNLDGVNLNCIYDNELLRFEYSSVASNDLCSRNKKIDVQDRLEEVDLDEGGDKQPTYINQLLISKKN